MSTGVSCELYVDRARLADTAAEYRANLPTALSGLKLTWGRGDVTEQPATSTCTFTVADIGGDLDFLDLLHVGARIDVYAAGNTTGSAVQDIAVDGGFESSDITTRVSTSPNSPAALSWTGDTPFAGSRALRILPDGYFIADVKIPPADLSDSPTAWDYLPQVRAGEQWTVDFAVRPGQPDRMTVQAGPAVYNSPAGGLNIYAPVSNVAPAAGWQRFSTPYTIPPDVPGWLGVCLQPTFRIWTTATSDGAWSAQPGSWQGWGTVDVDDVHIYAPATAQRRVLAFSGRLTDMHASAAGDGVSVDVTAVDWTADMANFFIGDVPWAVETMAARVARIIAFWNAGLGVYSAVRTIVDPVPGALPVSWRDVDNQSVMDLLTEMADTGDAVIWSAFASAQGFYLWYEDPTARMSFAMLAWNPGPGLVQITGNVNASRGIQLSACTILRDPVEWTQDVADVITRVNGTWQEQTLDDDGQQSPTERSYTLADEQAEVPVDVGGLGYGVRAMSYTTQLTSQADLSGVANRVLARSRALGWRVSGVEWDTRVPEQFGDADRTNLLALLDGTRRIGLPLTLTDMPGWTPTGDITQLYLEGGDYSFDDGRWDLSLTVSPSGANAYSAAWLDMDPAWAWRQFDPAIAWVELWGTTSSAASLRWRQLDKHKWTADPNTWVQYRGTGLNMQEAA